MKDDDAPAGQLNDQSRTDESSAAKERDRDAN